MRCDSRYQQRIQAIETISDDLGDECNIGRDEEKLLCRREGYDETCIIASG